MSANPAPLQSHFIDTDLGTVHVRVGGSGDPILFWPSLLMTGDLWNAQAAHFAPRAQVVVIDPPGHGRSQPLTRTFTYSECAHCVTQILDALEIGRAHFVGNSWGGMIGATFAASAPDRIGRAVLMNCTASAADRRQKIEYGAMLAVARALGGIRPPLTRSVLKAFLGVTTLGSRPDVVAQVRASLGQVDLKSAAWAVRSVVPGRPDQLGLLDRITAPVLVVAGAEDITFPAEHAAKMAAGIPNGHLVVLDGVGHLAAVEDPPTVNRLINEFVFDV
ncbi:alpha/beta hydrolase [Mycolicibacter sp. MYC340]|uniref:Alpha/beta hydrolase n=1 Tax=[Mycobacterium] nativiensis TaxID=2855503 RepID=A0ABU5XV60_9MYCO|nr:alpha/beta hydrolase [Mycolicibacter sp. MYC340]MEB3030620.1 alpha/beta hydrolase [Mycolicibacter sp. MYC340]